ncbi:MAG: hypothetical protein IJH63_14490 [Methanobrevibacter sp.]|nr:hypothetical protein [Methanobrevibacter sp.]
MRIIPLDNNIKNRYDSLFKIATHAFVNGLIPLLDLPEDDYIIISNEIFNPGHDMKIMDILLKGKNGYINIEFHKQPLSKSHLNRDFEYVLQCYFHYGETMDQKIVILDNDRKSVDKLQILKNLEYKADCYFTPEIDGATTLNIIKDKTMNNKILTDYEQYVFSILPLTNHGHDNVEKLVEELCHLTKELNIPEKNREAIAFCQMILVDIFVNNTTLKDKLMDVIRMTSSYIEERENRLRNISKEETLKAEKRAEKEKQKRIQAEQKTMQAEQKTMQAEEKQIQAEEKLKEIETIIKENTNDQKNQLNKKTIQKILAITSTI